MVGGSVVVDAVPVLESVVDWMAATMLPKLSSPASHVCDNMAYGVGAAINSSSVLEERLRSRIVVRT